MSFYLSKKSLGKWDAGFDAHGDYFGNYEELNAYINTELCEVLIIDLSSNRDLYVKLLDVLKVIT